MSTQPGDRIVTITAYRSSASRIILLHEDVPHLPADGKSPLKKRTIVHLKYGSDLLPGDLTALIGRMAAYMLASKRWRVAIPRGCEWHEVGGEAGSVPPGGGEGGASSDLDEHGTPPLTGLERSSTIMKPATSDRQKSAPRRSRGSAG